MALGFRNNTRYSNNNQGQSPFDTRGRNPQLRGFGTALGQRNTGAGMANSQFSQAWGQEGAQPMYQGQQPQQFQNAQQPNQQQPFLQQQPNNQNWQQPNQNQQRQQSGRLPSQQPGQQPYSDPSVTFEPLSDDVLKLLGSGQGAAPGAANSPETPNAAELSKTADIPAPPDNIMASEKALKMGQVLQNEQNSAAFYEHLSKLSSSAKNDRLTDLFEQISERSKNRADSFRNTFRKYNGMEFSSVDKPIYKPNNLNEGIKVAIREESNSINEIADLYDYDIDGRFGRELNAILCRKISDIGRLIGT